MPLTNFINQVTPVPATWLNNVDQVINGSLGIYSGAAYYGTDSGAVNAYVVLAATVIPAITVFPTAIGTLIRFTPLNTNTGAATFNTSAIIGEHGGPLTGGELSSAGPVLLQFTAGGWQIVATTGAQLGMNRTPAEIAAGVTPTLYFYPPGNWLRYGADPTGVTDSTVALNNASKSGAPSYGPAGTYKVTNVVNCPNKGQRFSGDGRFVTIVKAAATFSLSASGVFACATGEEGPVFQDLGIDCDQSAVASAGTRSGLIAYPPAIYAQSTPRFTVQNVRISNFLYGIDMRGNSGGAYITQVELGAYTIGIQIDGCLDTVRIRGLHSWPFGSPIAGNNQAMTANQQLIYNDGSNLGLYCGRCDDLNLDNCVFLNAGTQVSFIYSTGFGAVNPGAAFAQLTDCDFDSYGGLSIAAGQIQAVNCFFSLGVSASSYAVNITSSSATPPEALFTGCIIEAEAAMTNPYVTIAGTSNTARVSFKNCDFYSINQDNAALLCATSGASVALQMEGNWFFWNQNYAATKVLVSITSAGGTTDLIFTDNQTIEQGSGSSTFLSVTTDANSVIANNNFNGRSLVTPAGAYNVRIFGNTNVPTIPSVAWTIDGASDTLVIANGANAPFAVGAGMLLVHAQNLAQVAIYLAAGGGATLVSGGATWVASTTTPAAGHASVQYDGSTNYRIYNNTGGVITVGCVMLKANHGN